MAVKRINTGALGEPSGDAIPSSQINLLASDIAQNHCPNSIVGKQTLTSLDKKDRE